MNEQTMKQMLTECHQEVSKLANSYQNLANYIDGLSKEDLSNPEVMQACKKLFADIGGMFSLQALDGMLTAEP